MHTSSTICQLTHIHQHTNKHLLLSQGQRNQDCVISPRSLAVWQHKFELYTSSRRTQPLPWSNSGQTLHGPLHTTKPHTWAPTKPHTWAPALALIRRRAGAPWARSAHAAWRRSWARTPARSALGAPRPLGWSRTPWSGRLGPQTCTGATVLLHKYFRKVCCFVRFCLVHRAGQE